MYCFKLVCKQLDVDSNSRGRLTGNSIIYISGFTLSLVCFPEVLIDWFRQIWEVSVQCLLCVAKLSDNSYVSVLQIIIILSICSFLFIFFYLFHLSSILISLNTVLCVDNMLGSFPSPYLFFLETSPILVLRSFPCLLGAVIHFFHCVFIWEYFHAMINLALSRLIILNFFR